MASNDWLGQLRIEGETAWWSGSIGDAIAHRHFAAQCVFSTEPVAVIDARGQEFSGNCLLIEPDGLHRLLPAGQAEICYVEPATGLGLPAVVRERILDTEPLLISAGTVRPFWSAALRLAPRRALDPRVTSAIAAAEPLLARGTVRLADIFPASGLSIGRFRHLFASEMGMPFQRYILWCRLRTALSRLVDGRSVTDAAHSAGFADAAHFARTIKTMFGIRASDIFS